MKLTQEQIIIRYLAARPGTWTESHKLEKEDLDGHWIGTRGTRTARGLAEKGKFTDTDGTTHYIESRHTGKYAEFRVTHSEPKPTQPVTFIEKDGQRVAQLTLV
jgi:hypothetical protein